MWPLLDVDISVRRVSLSIFHYLDRIEGRISLEGSTCEVFSFFFLGVPPPNKYCRQCVLVTQEGLRSVEFDRKGRLAADDEFYF